MSDEYEREAHLTKTGHAVEARRMLKARGIPPRDIRRLQFEWRDEHTRWMKSPEGRAICKWMAEEINRG